MSGSGNRSSARRRPAVAVPLTIHRKDLECEDERRARAAQQGSGDTDGRKVPAAGAPVGIILARNFQKKRELVVCG